MTMYKLKPGQPKQPLVGLWVEDRNGAKIVHKSELVFEPDTVVETTLDFDSWVPTRLVKVEKAKGKAPKAVAPPAAPEASPEEDSDKGAVSVKGAESPEEGDYEELEDGTFHCLHCGKVLKTESGIVKHVENSH